MENSRCRFGRAGADVATSADDRDALEKGPCAFSLCWFPASAGSAILVRALVLCIRLFPAEGRMAGRQYTSGATAREEAGGEDGCRDARVQQQQKTESKLMLYWVPV